MRRDLDRREFLRQGGLLGGAAAAATLLPRDLLSLVPAPGSSMLDIGAAESPISHVVVLMMENRSFDHYLGWLAADENYLESGLSKHGRRFNVNGDPSQSYTDPEGRSTQTYYLPEKAGEENPYRGCEHPDPGHGWDDGRAQRDGGFLAEDSGNDVYALGYYKEPDIPFYASLARRFTIFDRFHCSILGPTYPNREYLHSGQSGGYKDNSTDPNGGFAWPTIWDRLAAANVPAAYYFVDLPVTALWGHRLLGITRHIEGFFEDCSAGTLPNVTFVDPGFTTGFRTDDHPFADIRSGQKYVRNIVKAFAESPHWESGALFITYDEWGGFFDHVAPPVLPDDRASAKDDDNFGQAGFRVPTLMASPYARPGYVDHTLYDHTSILRFLEWRFLGAPPKGPGKKGDKWFLTTRDRNANNIGSSLMATKPDPEFDTDASYEVPVTSAPCEDNPFELATASGAERSRYLEMHAFEKSLLDGYFEKVGYKIDLRSPPVEALPVT